MAMVRISSGSQAAITWWTAAPSPVPSFAAAELQPYFGRMAGSTIPVIEGRVAASPPLRLRRLRV